MRRPTQPEFVDFYLPFDGKLRAENRWVKLAGFVPWELVEDRYAGALAGTGMGAPALPGRVAFGALVIKERLGITDEETVAQVLENPYLQHFLGFREMLEEAPFDASMMVHFRARFGQLDYDEINGAIIRMACGDDDSATPEPEAEEAPANCGKLLIDASCPPADITYPTDLKLLNATREKLEHIIDELHRPLVGNQAKPRTYRRARCGKTAGHRMRSRNPAAPCAGRRLHFADGGGSCHRWSWGIPGETVVFWSRSNQHATGIPSSFFSRKIA